MLVFYLAALENEGERRQFSELYTRYYCQMGRRGRPVFPRRSSLGGGRRPQRFPASYQAFFKNF